MTELFTTRRLPRNDSILHKQFPFQVCGFSGSHVSGGCIPSILSKYHFLVASTICCIHSSSLFKTMTWITSSGSSTSSTFSVQNRENRSPYRLLSFTTDALSLRVTTLINHRMQKQFFRSSLVAIWGRLKQIYSEFTVKITSKPRENPVENYKPSSRHQATALLTPKTIFLSSSDFLRHHPTHI